MRSLKALALVGALLIAAPASAELSVSPLGDIYESFNDCLKVAQQDGLNKETLASLGWLRATITGPDGKPVAEQPIIYGNPKRKPVILLSAESGRGACIVMARIDQASTYSEFLKAWGSKLPAPDKDGAIAFFDEGHIVVIRQTGTNERPALSMAVATPLEKK